MESLKVMQNNKLKQDKSLYFVIIFTMTRDTYNCFYSLETTKIYKFKYYFKLNRNKSMNTSLYGGRSMGWGGGKLFSLKAFELSNKKNQQGFELSTKCFWWV